jgi:hypothetical protein
LRGFFIAVILALVHEDTSYIPINFHLPFPSPYVNRQDIRKPATPSVSAIAWSLTSDDDLKKTTNLF